jgi:hypothetical protein
MKLIKNGCGIMTTLAFNSKRLLLLFVELRMAFDEVGRPINTHSRRDGRGIDMVRTQDRIGDISKEFWPQGYSKFFQQLDMLYIIYRIIRRF